MEEIFPARVIDTSIALSLIVLTVIALPLLYVCDSYFGSFWIVFVAIAAICIVILLLFIYCARGRQCTFDDNGLSVKCMFFTQRIPYASVTKVRGHSDARQGNNGSGSVKISYKKTLTDFCLFGYWPLTMNIDGKDRVLEILRSKCGNRVFPRKG